MTEMKSNNGTMATEKDEIRKEVEQFYTNLYTLEEVNKKAAEELCAKDSPALTFCTPEAQVDLVKNITIKEVRDTFKEAPKGKVLGQTTYQWKCTGSSKNHLRLK
ncbi:hypothetical protein DSO57_1029594 [Entomophthora muscae]|uniref:Uncharacterized protein n=1 Tax=Entomophthora muscae TaxID=34485 RepID=A0ACC2TNK2_9FUNG|nr:hypothetical protein DSO57_1029594 [Entomophthora muscae]